MRKCQETSKICSLQQGFIISRFFFICFICFIAGVKKIVLVHYTKDLKLERTSLYGGSTLLPHGKKMLLIILYGT